MISPISPYSVSQVLLFPLSGYANRLQAMASSAILADAIGARLRICWQPQAVVPGSARDVFAGDLCDRSFLSLDEVHAEFGILPDDLPRYLTADSGRRMIILAGHDRGEQVFMPALQAALDRSEAEQTLVIIAGGKFCLPTPGIDDDSAQNAFRKERHDFYRSLTFAEPIAQAVAAAIEGRGPFLGLHLRYSDRSHQTPTDRSIRQALNQAAEESGLRSLFMASDTIAMREKWATLATGLGLEPWSVTHDSLDRSATGSASAALIDWRVLAHAQRMVYFAESSFAVEAAVASDGFPDSIGLEASSLRTGLVRGRQFLRAGFTYPSRHGWFG